MKEEEGKTRVERYADLRRSIERMDTLSFSDPDRDEKYGLNSNRDDYLHDVTITKEQAEDPHIKKNTLSISIDDLIKQNDEYVNTMEQKELDKQYKAARHRQRMLGKNKAIRLIIIISSIIIIAAVVLIVSLHAGGVF